ncbi:hypothetical protein Tco_0384592 [Tanacetum coccineum]
MFTDEHTLDYSSPPLYDDVNDDLEFDNDDVYDDPFDSKEDKIKESKLLIDELDPWNGYLRKGRKTKPKMTKPDTEWKSVEKTKSSQSPSLKKSTQVNPDKSKVKKS